MIRFENVFYRYNKEYIINNLSFTISSGEYICIVGKNGAGKSTVGRIIAGLLIPQRGNVYLNEYDLLDNSSLKEIRKLVGYIFQNPEDQIITTNVFDEVIFGLENLGFPREKMASVAEKALQKMDLLDFKNKMTSELSGGEKQRLAIASILALDVDILIFDESTSMIDPNGRMEIINIMKELKLMGKTIIHITHDMDAVLDSDDVLVLSNGSLVCQSSPAELFKNKEIIENNDLEVPFIIKAKEMLINVNKSNNNIINTIDDLAEVLNEYIS